MGQHYCSGKNKRSVVSVSGNHDAVLLGEAKWSEKPFRMKEIELMAERIRNRNPPVGMNGKLCHVLFLSSVWDGCPSGTRCNGVEIVTAEDVASGLKEYEDV